jgi:hypothetical protein
MTMLDSARGNENEQWCVLLPCSGTEFWAVPQNTLAEIVTLHDVGQRPPEQLYWRGVTVPVLDFGHDDGSPWREPVGGTGLVAVFLGLEGEGCNYWAMAVRGEGLAVRQISPEDVAEAPEAVLEHANSAFVLNGATYQVPDLVALQRRIAVSMQAA